MQAAIAKLPKEFNLSSAIESLIALTLNMILISSSIYALDTTFTPTPYKLAFICAMIPSVAWRSKSVPTIATVCGIFVWVKYFTNYVTALSAENGWDLSAIFWGCAKNESFCFGPNMTITCRG